MSQHLSAQQISQWVAGEHDAAYEQHLRVCPSCSAEVARLEEMLAQFRFAVRAWGRRHEPTPAVPARIPHRIRTAVLALAASALLVITAIPIYRGAHPARHGVKMAPADALLLEQVDLQVSRAVPRAMEPLLELASVIEERDDVQGKDRHDVTKQE